MEGMPLMAIGWVFAASGCDIVGSVLAKLSNGFKRKDIASLVILLQITSFVFLSFALDRIDLTVAYSMWGVIGIVATAFFGKIFFAETFHPIKLAGIATTLGAMVYIKMYV